MSDGPRFGKLLPDTSAGRDAVHVAVIPVVAGQHLAPGQHVAMVDGRAVFARKGTPVGIVDPFLDGPTVPAGSCFWLFLYPGTIRTLRHEWTHDAFPILPDVDPADVADALLGGSKTILREFAEDHGLDYNEFVESMAAGEPITLDRDNDPLPPDFWEHMERVTGRTFDKDHRDNTYFSCAC